MGPTGGSCAHMCSGLANEKKMLIAASAVKFAKLSGHEAPNEEECYFGSSPNTTANMWLTRLVNARLAAGEALGSTPKRSRRKCCKSSAGAYSSAKE